VHLDDFEELVDLSLADVVDDHLDLVIVVLDEQLLQLSQPVLQNVPEQIQSFFLVVLLLALRVHVVLGLLLHLHVLEVALLLVVLLLLLVPKLHLVLLLVVVALWLWLVVDEALHVDNVQVQQSLHEVEVLAVYSHTQGSVHPDVQLVKENVILSEYLDDVVQALHTASLSCVVEQ
jgi:hypothetical protein